MPLIGQVESLSSKSQQKQRLMVQIEGLRLRRSAHVHPDRIVALMQQVVPQHDVNYVADQRAVRPEGSEAVSKVRADSKYCMALWSEQIQITFRQSAPLQ
jgi:hypothetical protein